MTWTQSLRSQVYSLVLKNIDSGVYLLDSNPSPTPSLLCDLSFITCEMGVPASEGSWEVTSMCTCRVLKTGPEY